VSSLGLQCCKLSRTVSGYRHNSAAKRLKHHRIIILSRVAKSSVICQISIYSGDHVFIMECFRQTRCDRGRAIESSLLTVAIAILMTSLSAEPATNQRRVVSAVKTSHFLFVISFYNNKQLLLLHCHWFTALFCYRRHNTLQPRDGQSAQPSTNIRMQITIF